MLQREERILDREIGGILAAIEPSGKTTQKSVNVNRYTLETNRFYEFIDGERPGLTKSEHERFLLLFKIYRVSEQTF
jgi:hypothetical protein